MKRRFQYFIIVLLQLPIINAASAQEKLVTYPAPDGALLNTDYEVSVRTPGEEWQQIPVYLTPVDEVVNAKHTVRNSSVAFFDFSEHVEVQVVHTSGAVHNVRIRPLSYGIKADVVLDTVRFSLDQPRNLSVEVNGDIFGNLHLFANP